MGKKTGIKMRKPDPATVPTPVQAKVTTISTAPEPAPAAGSAPAHRNGDAGSRAKNSRANKSCIDNSRANSSCAGSPRTDGPCVYILRCGDGSLYTGWTNRFEKRLAAHRNGTGAKYTRGRGPLTPFYLEYMPDKSSAIRREAAIKKLPREKKLLLQYSPLNRLERHDK